MGPKVQAAIDFCSSGGHRAIIADLADGPAALEGRGGTLIRP
jgi:carbamate kinase